MLKNPPTIAQNTWNLNEHQTIDVEYIQIPEESPKNPN